MRPSDKLIGWMLLASSALIIALVIMLAACSHCHNCEPSQSWDQSNLKQFDNGCPTAIYYGPEAKLCPMY